MDNGGEGTSWVGNMFRKFETLCNEMDEVVRQGIGHVENQLQTIGANVANVCSTMDEEVSHFLTEVKDLGVDIVDSGASNVGIDEDHYKKESCDANNILSSFSMESTEEVQIDLSVEQNIEQNIDSRGTYEKLEVTDEKNHHEENIEWRDSFTKIESIPVVTFADASTTKSVEGILENDLHEAETNPSFDKEKRTLKRMKKETQKSAKKTIVESGGESDDESGGESDYESVESDHESVIKQSEELETNEDSDWVIV